MKLFKLIALLFMFAVFTSSTYASQNCGEIKGNIVGKLFCKAKSNYSGDSVASEATSSDVTVTSESSGEKKKWKFWSRPEWTKKKN
jgi:hypothetical protein